MWVCHKGKLHSIALKTYLSNGTGYPKHQDVKQYSRMPLYKPHRLHSFTSHNQTCTHRGGKKGGGGGGGGERGEGDRGEEEREWNNCHRDKSGHIHFTRMAPNNLIAMVIIPLYWDVGLGCGIVLSPYLLHTHTHTHSFLYLHTLTNGKVDSCVDIDGIHHI